MGQLYGEELEQFEEHLLLCEHCQVVVADEDEFLTGMRGAGALVSTPASVCC
jgi:hypothetical protein